MIIYSLLAGAFLLLAYLITTLLYQHKSSLLLTGVALCLCAATGSLAYFFATFNSLPALMPFYRVAGAVMFFIPPLLLLLIALITKAIDNRRVFVTIFLSFGTSALLGGMQIFYPPPFTQMPFSDSSGLNIPATLFQIHLILNALLSTWLTYSASTKASTRRSTTGTELRQPNAMLIAIACTTVAALATLGFVFYQQPFTIVGSLVTLWLIIPVALDKELFRYQKPEGISAVKKGVVGGLTAIGLWIALWIFFHPVLRSEEQAVLPAIASTGLLIAIAMESYPHLIKCLKIRLHQSPRGENFSIEEVAEHIVHDFVSCDTTQRLHHLIEDLLERYIGVKNYALYLSSTFLCKQGWTFYHIDLQHSENMITETTLTDFFDGELLAVFEGSELYDIKSQSMIPNHAISLLSASAAIPILFQGQPIGALFLGRHQQGYYPIAKRQLLREICHHTGRVLARLITQQIVRETQRLIIQRNELTDFKRVIHDEKNAAGSVPGIMQFYAPLMQKTEPTGTEAANNTLPGFNQASTLLSGKQQQESFLQLNNVIKRVTDRFVLSTIELELSHLPDIYGNEEEIECVLENLLKNAIDAEGIKGHEQTVTVKTWCDTDCRLIACEVSDRGGGVRADILPTLWQDKVTTKPYGSGIGLPLVKKIVARHRGAITVDSIPGEGTTFTFSLPAVRKPTGRTTSTIGA